MKEPGLDDRRRDRGGEIQQKRGDTLNKEPTRGRNSRIFAERATGHNAQGDGQDQHQGCAKSREET